MADLDYGYEITIETPGTSDPVTTPTNQWQRKPDGGNWVDIAGETGETYTVTMEDRSAQIRLVQNFGGLRAESNELQVTDREPGFEERDKIEIYVKSPNPYAFIWIKFESHDGSSPVVWQVKKDPNERYNWETRWKYDTDTIWGMSPTALPVIADRYYVFLTQYMKSVTFLRHGDFPGEEYEILDTTDLGDITDLSSCFYGNSWLNQDLSWLDVSNVTNMQSMFERCTSFNQDLSGWCVEKIGSEPTKFAEGSALEDSNKPNWGAPC